ncbi:MAG: FAD:protein FMN transferase [Epsilonproteobacteria bacterium]|nr:FAD:protein FMN transferase [Campylobacterota bacterium]
MTKNIFQFEAMTTPCEVVIFLQDGIKAKAIANEILDNTKRLEKKYNYFSKDSFLSKLNDRIENRLDNETKELLQKGKLFYGKTNCIFDITIATIKPLYKLKTLKELEEKKEALLSYMGCEHFMIKKEKLLFDNPFTKIDLGGMVKEFAVDEAVKILKKSKISHGLVNFGGDLYVLGTKPSGEKFTVGIKNPHNPTEHITTVTLENEALTTSAHYERNFTIEEESFSHIITSKKKSNEIISATVISPTTLLSGVYSTALLCDDTIKSQYKTITIKSNMEVCYENFNR